MIILAITLWVLMMLFMGAAKLCDKYEVQFWFAPSVTMAIISGALGIFTVALWLGGVR